jgi:hypothetical protein
MAITLKVIGNGHFEGAETNLSSYSASEDSTPIEPSDSSGGTGEVSFTVTEDSGPEGSILLRGDTVELEDGSNGRTRGLVTGVGGSGGEARLTAAARLNKLVINCVMPPFQGTLEAAFRYYLSIGGISDGIVVDASIAARPVVLPAWSGNLWDYLKKLCVAEQVEVSLVSSNVVLRPLRGRVVTPLTNSEERWSVEDGELAQSVEVYYYNNKYSQQALVYPVSPLVVTPIMQVATAEVTVTNVKLDASVYSVQQPRAVQSVGNFYVGVESVYSILDSDGVTIDPVKWTNAGGSLSVELGEDRRSLIITLVGPSNLDNAPFRVAASEGHTAAYSSIKIVGIAVESTPVLLTIPTGVPASRSSQLVGTTIDNPFISTIAQAYSVGMITAGKFAGAKQTVSVSASVVNRDGEIGSTRYPTFAEFTTQQGTATFADFNAASGTDTYEDFTAALFAEVADNFENQAFGNIAGARVLFREAWYRIRSANISHDIMSYSGEKDTLFSDFDSVWSGATFADFSARMTGKTYEDFGVIPLWR